MRCALMVSTGNTAMLPTTPANPPTMSFCANVSGWSAAATSLLVTAEDAGTVDCGESRVVVARMPDNPEVLRRKG